MQMHSNGRDDADDSIDGIAPRRVRAQRLFSRIPQPHRPIGALARHRGPRYGQYQIGEHAFATVRQMDHLAPRRWSRLRPVTIDKLSLTLTRPGALFFDRVQLHDEQTGLRSRVATFDSYSEMTERFCLFSAELSVVVCISQSCI